MARFHHPSAAELPADFYQAHDYNGPTKAPPAAMCKYGTEQMATLHKPKRVRLNWTGIAIAVLTPWMVYNVIFSFLSFETHRTHPYQIYFMAFCVIVAGCAFLMHYLHNQYVSLRDGLADLMSSGHEWFFFAGVTLIFGTAAAIVFGNVNYLTTTEPYYDLKELGNYKGVDPTAAGGTRFMDAGIVEFTNDSFIEAGKAIGFKDDSVYCVAPITRGKLPLASYDFFAVGKDCCNGFPGDFKCGDYLTSTCHHGLRLMQDEDRPYYQLAVQQMEAEFGIKAIHPVFFEWTARPEIVMQTVLASGRWNMVIFMLLSLVAQALATVYYLYFLEKTGRMDMRLFRDLKAPDLRPYNPFLVA